MIPVISRTRKRRDFVDKNIYLMDPAITLGAKGKFEV